VSLRRPARLRTFSYRGKHRYFVTCSTDKRRRLLRDRDVVCELASQILRTCDDRTFDVIAYVFMEDHVHLLLEGRCERSDFRSTMTLVRKRTAMAYRRAAADRLWQDGYYERVLRPPYVTAARPAA
jgi:REP element-mobilizing transposase RayT